MTNILKAIHNLVNNPVSDVVTYYKSNNRANATGDSLEEYIKDLFCNGFDLSPTEKKIEYSKVFSLLGNQNNPPDFILDGGDAVEVKKMEGFGSSLALNSSYPKNKLLSSSPLLTKACLECEDGWIEKDIIYAVGTVKQKQLKALWFVYGDCYAADKEVYERIGNSVSTAVNSLGDVKLSKTKELGRVNEVDPLGVTNLRIRGMWTISHPSKVFSSIASVSTSHQCTVHTIMLQNKYVAFPQENREALEAIKNEAFSIKDVRIQSPDNPANLLDAKLISFYF